MATKACPDCDQQIPVACKSCPCGFVFISRRLLNAKQTEKSPPPNLDNKSVAKRRRTDRARREKANSPLTKDLENRKRSRSESHSEQIRRRRGRPKTGPSKKHDDDKERQEKEIDVYASLSDERAFVFSVALAEINRKIINQKLILWQKRGQVGKLTTTQDSDSSSVYSTKADFVPSHFQQYGGKPTLAHCWTTVCNGKASRRHGCGHAVTSTCTPNLKQTNALNSNPNFVQE